MNSEDGHHDLIISGLIRAIYVGRSELNFRRGQGFPLVAEIVITSLFYTLSPIVARKRIKGSRDID